MGRGYRILVIACQGNLVASMGARVPPAIFPTFPSLKRLPPRRRGALRPRTAEHRGDRALPRLRILDQRHESEVLMLLHVAVQQGGARIVGHEVDLHGLPPRHVHHILQETRGRLSRHIRQFEAVHRPSGHPKAGDVTLRAPIGRAAMRVMAHPAFHIAFVGCVRVPRHCSGALSHLGQVPVTPDTPSRRGLRFRSALVVAGAAREPGVLVAIREEGQILRPGAGGP